jgi:hypothetical protein
MEAAHLQQQPLRVGERQQVRRLGTTPETKREKKLAIRGDTVHHIQLLRGAAAGGGSAAAVLVALP